MTLHRDPEWRTAQNHRPAAEAIARIYCDEGRTDAVPKLQKLSAVIGNWEIIKCVTLRQMQNIVIQSKKRYILEKFNRCPITESLVFSLN